MSIDNYNRGGTALSEPGESAAAPISLVLARLIGPALVAMAASLLINRHAMADLAAQVSRDWSIVYLSGILLFIAGIAIVERHNVWSGWPAIISLLGWLAIVGGLARMMFFRQLTDLAGRFVANPMAVLVPGLALLLLGVFLTLKGFRMLG